MNTKEAAHLLGLETTLFSAEDVSGAYRERAKAAHPDAGGSSDAFEAVRQARDVLLAWLAKRPVERPACLACHGKGTIAFGRGFKPVSSRCRQCNGTGERGDDE